MSETNCSVHETCMWELALGGAKRNAETAIHRMEKAESELTKLRKRVECLESALKVLRIAVNDKQPDPGAVAFIDKALTESDKIAGE